MKKILVFGMAAGPLLSMAHEGHGVVTEGPGHYLFTAEHALPVLAALALGVIYFAARKKRRNA